jgi:hypothetical protein
MERLELDMTHRKKQPLIEAVLAGLPMALLVALVLYLTGVQGRLLLTGVLIALGIGAAFELLSARPLWARLTGGIMALAVIGAIAMSWGDWRGLYTAWDEERTAETTRKGFRVPWSSGPTTAPPAPRDGRSGSGAGATASQPVSSTTTRAPAGAQPGPAATPDAVAGPPPDGALTTLTVRNELDTPVEVTLRRSLLNRSTWTLAAGEELELRLGDVDPARARVAWRNGDVSGSASWADLAARGPDIPIRRE